MSKWCGNIGFVSTEDDGTGNWLPQTVERQYYGDLVNIKSRWSKSDGVNDDLTINNRLSVIADPYAQENLKSMKYAVYMGSQWHITGVEVQYPRLLLDLGGVYNG